MKTISHYEMDMTTGSIFRKIVRYSIPLMLTGILQLLYNAADIIVVGQYSGKEALAAVGSTGSLINLLINIFMGLSVGTSVVVAQHQGAGNRHAVMETVHTSMALALICGFSIGLFGFLMAKPILLWMGSPEDVIDASSLYVRIYFLGMPANMLYTFGSAILRAVGDTKRPLYYLSVAGLVNIGLNLFFVIVLKMSVAGVALATIISQAISAVLVIHCLTHSTGTVRYIPKLTHLHREPLRQILHIGLPAGLQGSLFSISNVLIQSSVNSFGSVVMAGSAASSNLEGFVYTTMDSICQACLTFVGQNAGARRYSRVRRILWICMAVCTFVGVLTGGLFSLFAPQLISIYNTDPVVIQWGAKRLVIICLTYFLCGQMNVLVGQMRGLGYSVFPMITTLAGVCGLRIVWIYTYFALHPTLEVLMWSYPLSWFVTVVCHAITYYVLQKRFPREDLPLPNTVSA
ncbi:MAG TPA: MATE family efflux transporter [Candidatus Limiplasma sp.]|nr:MATE family efflux transporter [Candidatus Limiplasma sp.]